MSEGFCYHYRAKKYLNLEHIEYPQNPEMNVYYEYAAPNTGNQSGRLVKQQDASGVQTFEYGNMGELIKNIHTFVVPNGNHYTFETNWEYDSWNRMKKILYPDGEMVSYHYDNGGKLYSMDGDKSGQTYYYINAVSYNKYGSRSRIDYGNNTYAEYTYNPLNQRLSNLTSYEDGGAIMQNIDYSYDNASNITAIKNTSDYVSGGLGGNYSHEYVYDDLYRLSFGTGNFQSANFGNNGYKQTMEYSASGNILHKTVDASKEIGGGIQNTSYDRYYEYNDRPHTVTSTGDFSYDWDANGNQIHRGGPGDRFLCWDEENRLMAVHETGEQPTYSAYIYDAGGERAWKMSSDVVAMYINGQGMNYAELVKTLYVNPYMVVTEQEYSKHYYIEGERVCTKIGGGFGPGPNIPVDGELPLLQDDYETVRQKLWDMTMRFRECTQGPDITINENLDPCHNGEDYPEDLQYFYHSDHLGSSSFITNALGHAEQHLQYLPFGETFVDQQNGYDSRYTFSAKEKDDETQYSYFGARYYDSDLSVWLSVDPMAGERSWISPYNYCQYNPVGRVDPTGALDKKPDDYFDSETGVFLGDDKDLGVTTDNVRIITKEKWDAIQSNTERSDGQKALSLHTAGKKFDWKNPVSSAIAKGIANHYYAKAGYNLNDLNGGSVEIMGAYTYSTNEYGHKTSRQSPLADIDLLESGKLRLRVNGASYGSSNGNGFSNRWDFISLFQHERGMHGRDWLNGVPYNTNTEYSWESRAYNFQINVNWNTFKKTSLGFQSMMLENAAEYGVFPIYH